MRYWLFNIHVRDGWLKKDGWLSMEMGGYVGRWVASRERGEAKHREMGGYELVARLLERQVILYCELYKYTHHTVYQVVNGNAEGIVLRDLI